MAFDLVLTAGHTELAVAVPPDPVTMTLSTGNVHLTCMTKLVSSTEQLTNSTMAVTYWAATPRLSLRTRTRAESAPQLSVRLRDREVRPRWLCNPQWIKNVMSVVRSFGVIQPIIMDTTALIVQTESVLITKTQCRRCLQKFTLSTSRVPFIEYACVTYPWVQTTII